MAVASREDEIRLLRLEMLEVMRSVGVTRQLLPTIPLLDQDIAKLQEELLRVRAQVTPPNASAPSTPSTSSTPSVIVATEGVCRYVMFYFSLACGRVP